jgi:predicted nucleic acid-binding protein
VYLIDTNVVSEARKASRANPGVRRFFDAAAADAQRLYLSAVTVGELRRGVELIRHRGDQAQAARLDEWLTRILTDYQSLILSLDIDVAQVWGRSRVPRHENALDKQIAATALVYDLTLVTGNTDDFVGTGVRILNPFTASLNQSSNRRPTQAVSISQ